MSPPSFWSCPWSSPEPVVELVEPGLVLGGVQARLLGARHDRFQVGLLLRGGLQVVLAVPDPLLLVGFGLGGGGRVGLPLGLEAVGLGVGLGRLVLLGLDVVVVLLLVGLVVGVALVGGGLRVLALLLVFVGFRAGLLGLVAGGALLRRFSGRRSAAGDGWWLRPRAARWFGWRGGGDVAPVPAPDASAAITPMGPVTAAFPTPPSMFVSR